jgi:hypothetical protein
LQKYMKPHCVRYILYRGIGYGTLYSTALSIGVVSARGSYKCIIKRLFFKSLLTDIRAFENCDLARLRANAFLVYF